ncbi:MAG: ATP-dependent DNA helicase RecG [Lachnospiraceae bacterium]|nr:ATP-dependent DNA helicase RecG [Lachnospiraceae bacterium]
MQLNDSVKTIKGIGDKLQELFAKVSVNSVGELMTYYPVRYEDYKLPQDINTVRDGETCVICACVSNVKDNGTKSRIKVITCKANDPTGEVELVWFNQPYVKYELKAGYHYIFRGKVVQKGKKLSVEQAKIYRREDYFKLQNSLQPVYSLTKGLTNNAITKAMKQALVLAEDFPEYLPSATRKKYDVLKKKHALQEIHFPKSEETMLEARRSLVFEEFFLFGVFLRAMSKGRECAKSEAVITDNGMCEKLMGELPFKLTKGQLEAFENIKKDMTSGNVMARLVQGDVGSGKTIIAVLAMLLCASNGYQAAIMAPTEVLAEQHYSSMYGVFKRYGLKCELLTGSMTAKEKKEAYARIAAHEADIIIGTHTLFQEKLEFDNLALCITDEQHRFGVKQREKLGKKGMNPHILVMSATPIPRTLAMMLYGDMDISLVKELPADRLAIKNCVVGPEYRPTAYKFMAEQVKQGRQCYVICPMVDETEESDGENVTDYSARLQETFGDEIRVGMLHGKMKPTEKNIIMHKFSTGEIDILVSTTVVEVGVNVPNATVMMIENADRFGLAQLHQLRGRVGRGAYQSYCIFMYGNKSDDALERLNILKTSNDGFYIANEDLKLRGPGDLFGIRQSGELYFKIGDIYNDSDVLTKAYEAAHELTDKEADEVMRKLYESSAKEVFKFLENYATI